MKIAVIVGSHRKNSQSTRISNIVIEKISQLGMSTEVMDLRGNPLPLWDEEIWSKSEKWTKLWTPFSDKLKESQGLVIISPEWAGMAPPGLKNFLLFCSGKELAHKPCYLIGISSGISGTYPIAELRMSGFKNNKMCYLPEHLIIRNVEKFLIDPNQKTDIEKNLEGRLDYGLLALKEYATAFNTVRENLKDLEQKFSNGM